MAAAVVLRTPARQTTILSLIPVWFEFTDAR
jgi:hypothetical protein